METMTRYDFTLSCPMYEVMCVSMQARSAFIAYQKMGRLGTADEIASMVVYLASDEVN